MLASINNIDHGVYVSYGQCVMDRVLNFADFEFYGF